MIVEVLVIAVAIAVSAAVGVLLGKAAESVLFTFRRRHPN